MKVVAHSIVASLAGLAMGLPGSAGAQERVVRIDASSAREPVDHFFDMSVGSDFPGTLKRADSQAQLQIVSDELGFRYIRFHDIFHDVLGTVRKEDGRIVGRVRQRGVNSVVASGLHFQAALGVICSG